MRPGPTFLIKQIASHFCLLTEKFKAPHFAIKMCLLLARSFIHPSPSSLSLSVSLPLFLCPLSFTFVSPLTILCVPPLLSIFSYVSSLCVPSMSLPCLLHLFLPLCLPIPCFLCLPLRSPPVCPLPFPSPLCLVLFLPLPFFVSPLFAAPSVSLCRFPALFLHLCLFPCLPLCLLSCLSPPPPYFSVLSLLKFLYSLSLLLLLFPIVFHNSRFFPPALPFQSCSAVNALDLTNKTEKKPCRKCQAAIFCNSVSRRNLEAWINAYKARLYESLIRISAVTVFLFHFGGSLVIRLFLTNVSQMFSTQLSFIKKTLLRESYL